MIGVFERRGSRAFVRSVLGDVREADVHPGPEIEGRSYPWITCPFCGSGVYLGDLPPDHPSPGLGAHDGRCINPACPANPMLPVDAARIARGEAILREMADQSRQRDHSAAMQRIADERAEREAAWDAIRKEAEATGACLRCAHYEFHRLGRKKLITHRSRCPRALR